MIDDAQTHTLPEDPRKLRALAIFLGYADLDAFADELLATLRRVEGHYAELFEDAPALTSPDGGRRQPGVHRRRGRSGDAGDPAAAGLRQRRRRSMRRCAAGTTAAAGRCAASAPANC